MAGRRSRVAAVGTLGLLAAVLLAAVVWLGRDYTSQGATPANTSAAVIGVAITVATILVSLVRYWWNISNTGTRPANNTETNLTAATLADYVYLQQVAEKTARDLVIAQPMPIRWHVGRAALMDHPKNITRDGIVEFSGTSEDIDALVDDLLRFRRGRTVILGGAGTGKSTLASQIAFEMVKRRKADPGDLPVPVVVSLAGWAPAEQARIEDWMTEQILQDYPALLSIGRPAIRAIVEQHRVLPVLDGMDEMQSIRRPTVIAALNGYFSGGFILTCRTDIYVQAIADAPVNGAVVIVPMFLSSQEIGAYLERRLRGRSLEPWKAVLAELDRGTAVTLAAVSATPLALWMICSVYINGNGDPNSLIDGTFKDAAALQSQLLESFVEATLRMRPPTSRRYADGTRVPHPSAGLERRYDPIRFENWLRQVAIRLERESARDWQWWTLADYAFQSATGKILVRISIGLVVAVLTGVVMSFGYDPYVSSAMGAAGFIAGYRRASLNRVPGRQSFTIRDWRSRSGGWKSVFHPRMGLLFAVAFGVVAGLTAAVALGRLQGALAGILIGVVAIVAIGVATLIPKLVVSTAAAVRATSPHDSFRWDRQSSFVAAVISGPVYGLIVGGVVGTFFALASGLGVLSSTTQVAGMDVGLSPRFNGPLAVGLDAAVAIGSAVSIGATLIIMVAESACTAFVLAVVVLRLRKLAPLRLFDMLDDARRAGLIRVAGPSYQFGHIEFQRFLASSGIQNAVTVQHDTPKR